MRTEAVQRAWLAIAIHKLHKDSVGAYCYNDDATFIENVKGMLEGKYWENTTYGMKGLVIATPNELTGFKANATITRDDVNR